MKKLSEKELEEIVVYLKKEFEVFKKRMNENLSNSFVGKEPIHFFTMLAISLPHKEMIRQFIGFDCDGYFVQVVSEKSKELFLESLKKKSPSHV